MRQDFLSIRGGLCITAIAALALPLLTSGCGGDEGSEANAEITVETGSLSKAEFVKRADEMCRESKGQAVREFQAFMSEQGQSGQISPEQEEARLGEVVETIIVPLYDKLIDQLSAIGAPAGDEEEVEAFLVTLRRNLDRTEEEPATALNSLNSPFKPAAERALKYGLKVCAFSLA